MELIHQSYGGLTTTPLDPEQALLHVEGAGRQCYQSMDKIGPGSAIKLYNQLKTGGHTSVFEHADIVLQSKPEAPLVIGETSYVIKASKYITHFRDKDTGTQYLYGNWRAWYECLLKLYGVQGMDITWFELYDKVGAILSQYTLATDEQSVPNQIKRVSVNLTTDRAILAEITRHRVMSFSVESQRYVKYDGIVFVLPYWYDSGTSLQQSLFNQSCLRTEEEYRALRDTGLPPQAARAVLTNQVSVNMTISGYQCDWDWLFTLRTAPGVYPQFLKLSVPLKEHCHSKSWWA